MPENYSFNFSRFTPPSTDFAGMAADADAKAAQLAWLSGLGIDITYANSFPANVTGLGITEEQWLQMHAQFFVVPGGIAIGKVTMTKDSAGAFVNYLILEMIQSHTDEVMNGPLITRTDFYVIDEDDMDDPSFRVNGCIVKIA